MSLERIGKYNVNLGNNKRLKEHFIFSLTLNFQIYNYALVT